MANLIKLRDILRISASRKMKINIHSRQEFNDETYIEHVLARISEENRAPTVLWNMRPYDNYTHIHAIFNKKIEHLLSLGFKAQVILYDKIVEKILRMKGQNEMDNHRRNTKKNIAWMSKSGLSIKDTEFLTESLLWEKIDFNDFSNKITFIAQLFSGKVGDLRVDDILDRLWELYYEEMIQCDFVLTGERDAHEIWNKIRQFTVSENNFNYNPPVVLVFPKISGLNNERIDPSDKGASLTIYDTKDLITEKLTDAADDFIQDMYELLIMEELNGEINGQPCSTFKNIQEISNFNPRAFAADYFYNKFQQIKNG